MNDDDTPRYTSIADYLQLLRKQWLLIVLPAVLAAGAALFLSERAKPTYQAQAAVSIQGETQMLSLLGASVLPNSGPGTTPSVVADTIQSPALARAVKHRLKTTLPAATLSDQVSLSVDTTTQLVNVNASASTGRFAAALANAFATEIAVQTTDATKRQLSTAISSLQRRLHQLKPSVVSNVGERSTLQDEISRLDFLRANASSGQVAKYAVVPQSPSSPKPTRNTLLGLLAGLLIGLVLAFVRESLDRRLRGSAAIHDELGYPLLGQVRGRTMGRTVIPNGAADADSAGDIETFRILRRNVDLMLGDRSRRAVMVTSALPEEGKSTVAASLAFASAATGRSTLLLEADFRRPTLASRLKAEPEPGLTEYLTGKAAPEDILQTVLLAPSHGAAPSTNGRPGKPLAYISAGAPSPQSAEILASTKMRELLQEVTEVYDLVILDTAPLLPVADSLELLANVDGVILCVRSGRTTKDQGRAARTALEKFPAQAIGVVVTGLQPRDEPAGYGMYPYSYSYAERVSQ